MAALLPPKKAEMDPKPAVVDEVPFEESDIVDVREPPFPAGPHFFDDGLDSQFGEGADEEGWEDDDDEEDHMGHGAAPECRQQ